MRRPKPQNDMYAALGPIRSWIWGLIFILGFGMMLFVNFFVLRGPWPETSLPRQVFGRLALLICLFMVGDAALGFILRVALNHPWRLLGPLTCRYLDFISSLNKTPPQGRPKDGPSENRDL